MITYSVKQRVNALLMRQDYREVRDVGHICILFITKTWIYVTLASLE